MNVLETRYVPAAHCDGGGFSAMTGATVGGIAVYQVVKHGQSQVEPIQLPKPVNTSNADQTITLNTTEVETTITQAVKKVGPTVVTVVGTIPG